MATFGLTPVAGFPPATPDTFPENTQYQQDGVDVGTRAVDTVNFTGDGVTVTAGVGENANVLTVNVDGGGGGGGAGSLVVQLASTQPWSFTLDPMTSWDDTTVLAQTATVTWVNDGTNSRVEISETGIYEVKIAARVLSGETGTDDWPISDQSQVGSFLLGAVEPSATAYFRGAVDADLATTNYMEWTDTLIIVVDAGVSLPTELRPGMYATWYGGEGGGFATFDGWVTVTKIAEAPVPT